MHSKYFALWTSVAVAMALRVSAGTLTVEVRDAQGAPVGDAVVSASPADGRTLPVRPRPAIMDQKDRTFVPRVLPVQVGASVKFPNSDDIQHSVYSFSPAKPFQLPLYKGTPSNPIVFTAPGVVTLGCNIHDKMNGYIVILETPYFEKTESSGRAELRGLPAGQYTIEVWQPDARDVPAPQTVTVGDDPVVKTFTITIAPVIAAPPANKLEDKFKKYGHGQP